MNGADIEDILVYWTLAERQRDFYRFMALAALDQLHAAQQTIDRQREQIIELREDIIRYGRKVVAA